MRTRSPKGLPEKLVLTSDNIDTEVVMMEINKPIIENLYSICNDVFMPVLGNPLNMLGWSDLVSKDLMDKFHSFRSHTLVTKGQINDETLLPQPPTEVVQNEKTSSKDKSNLFESAIVQWSK